MLLDVYSPEFPFGGQFRMLLVPLWRQRSTCDRNDTESRTMANAKSQTLLCSLGMATINTVAGRNTAGRHNTLVHAAMHPGWPQTCATWAPAAHKSIILIQAAHCVLESVGCGCCESCLRVGGSGLSGLIDMTPATSRIHHVVHHRVQLRSL